MLHGACNTDLNMRSSQIKLLHGIPKFVTGCVHAVFSVSPDRLRISRRKRRNDEVVVHTRGKLRGDLHASGIGNPRVGGTDRHLWDRTVIFIQYFGVRHGQAGREQAGSEERPASQAGGHLVLDVREVRESRCARWSVLLRVFTRHLASVENEGNLICRPFIGGNCEKYLASVRTKAICRPFIGGNCETPSFRFSGGPIICRSLVEI